MRGHDDISVHAQAFVLDAEVQAIGDDFAGFFADEDGKPIHDREGRKVDSDTFHDAIAFQCACPFRLCRMIIT